MFTRKVGIALTVSKEINCTVRPRGVITAFDSCGGDCRYDLNFGPGAILRHSFRFRLYRHKNAIELFKVGSA